MINSKTLTSVIPYTYAIGWIFVSLLFILFGAQFPINLSLSSSFDTTALSSVVTNAQNGWMYYTLIYGISFITDVGLAFLGVAITRAFIHHDNLLAKLVNYSFMMAGLLSIIADILNIVIYQAFGVMAPALNAVEMSSFAVMFTVLSQFSIWLAGCFSFFFGALGLLFTYFLVKTSKDASKSSWRRFTLFTAIIAALTFVFSLAALLSQNATLINVALISIMLPVPVINLIWVASFVRQARKVIRD